jgi:hypothetical protein
LTKVATNQAVVAVLDVLKAKCKIIKKDELEYVQ